MTKTKRFTVAVDETLYERLVDVTEKQEPHLPKRYVIELALKRLFDDLDGGQMKLGLETHGQRR